MRISEILTPYHTKILKAISSTCSILNSLLLLTKVDALQSKISSKFILRGAWQIMLAIRFFLKLTGCWHHRVTYEYFLLLEGQDLKRVYVLLIKIQKNVGLQNAKWGVYSRFNGPDGQTGYIVSTFSLTNARPVSEYIQNFSKISLSILS